MTVYLARITAHAALAAALLWTGACGRSERPGAQQSSNEVRAVAQPQRFLDLQRPLDAQSDASLQLNLGLRYAVGDGVPQDDAEAVRWYRLAADQGDALAQGNLGVMYATGRGIQQDDAEATRWFRRAADQSNPDGQVRLGVMYASGRGVPEDHAEAARLFRLAADQGNALAQ